MLKWEIFEKGKVEVIAKEFEPSYLLTQEMTLIPCILVRSDTGHSLLFFHRESWL